MQAPEGAPKNMKNMAELMPLDSARGPTPRKKGAMPLPSATTERKAPVSVGRVAAEHIMRVLSTSSGVVDAAARAPAVPPMTRSSRRDAWSRLLPVMRWWATRIDS